MTSKAITILMADDDEEDRDMTREALAESRLTNPIRFVCDGEELMEYLRQEGRYAEPGSAPRPGVILLDLDMPRKDGHEALAEIKADPALRQIPIVILSTSQAETEIHHSYDLGASSYISKPVTFDRLVELVRAFGRYWLEIVELPPDEDQR